MEVVAKEIVPQPCTEMSALNGRYSPSYDWCLGWYKRNRNCCYLLFICCPECIWKGTIVGIPARAMQPKITFTVTHRTEKDFSGFEARCNNINGL